MYDITGDGLRYLSYNSCQIPTAEITALSKYLPKNVASIRNTSCTGNSLRDTVQQLALSCTRAVGTFQSNPELDTLIIVCPQFAVGRFDIVSTTHLNGFRDLDKNEVIKTREPFVFDSLSLVEEFKSGKNFIRDESTTDENGLTTGRIEIFESYTLGQVYKAEDSFRDLIVEYSREEHRNVIKNIFVVTSTYHEDYTIATMKAFHILMKGVLKALELKDKTNLKKWIEQHRRQGARNYISTLVDRQKNAKNDLERQMRDLKTQMNEYFKKLEPIDFFLRYPDDILEKISKEMVNCEKINDVSSAYLDDNGSFHIFTEHIYIKQPTVKTIIPSLDRVSDAMIIEENNNDYWDIGRLHITVNTEGKTYIVSNTRQVKGHGGRYVGHPHVVDSDNSVCLGEIKLAVYELIKRHDYTTLAGLLVNFAKSVNHTDMAGKTIQRWPVVQLNPS